MIISGRITDANTGEGLPYVNISYNRSKGISGTTTNGEGYFTINSSGWIDTLTVQYTGYEKMRIKVKRKGTQTLNVQMKPQSIVLHTAQITAKREKYSRKNNPAVELIGKVQEHKNQNSLAHNEYYQYRKHEKMELSISNISDSARYKKPFNKIDFVFDNLQVSELNGKNYIPFYFMETLSEIYYRKNPENFKKMIVGSKDVEISKFLDPQSLEYIMQQIFGEINIYENSISLLSNEFISPLSPYATRFYRFYIIDTTFYKGDSCINLAFTPANKQDFGFSGNFWITKDSNYTVRKIRMELPSGSGVNFVEGLLLEQEYDLNNNQLCLTLDKLTIDFSGYGLHMHGRKTNAYRDFIFNKPMEANFYNSHDLTQRIPNYNKQTNTYWTENRIAPLTESEEKTYDIINNLNNVTFYKAAINTIMAFTSGYVEFGKFDWGPVENTISWNSIEGVRFRIGGKTNMNFNKRLFFEGFLAFGTTDQRLKYKASAMYTFNEKKYNQWEFPLNLLTLSYEYNTDIPGQELLMGTPDRLFLSFNRGNIDKMTFNRSLSLQYEYETNRQLAIRLKTELLQQEPLANLNFTSVDGNTVYNPLTTANFTIGLRYAQNEKFYQQQRYRISFNSTAPIYTFDYTFGAPVFGADFTYHKVELEFQKRWFVLSFGFADLTIGAGKIFGNVPYSLLFVHHANQNWAYQDEAFNLMNYFEFVSEQYAQIIFNYNFNGFLFNRIPLIRKLKWRECFAIKSVWGYVSSNNIPDAENNPHLIPFPTTTEGVSNTFSLNNMPYIEGNIGIDNIFKVLRLDYVRRFTYLDNPGIAKWGIRFRLRITF